MSLMLIVKRSLFYSCLVVGGLFLCAGCSGENELHNDEMVSYSSTARIRGLDPAKSGEVSSSLAIARIYEGLLQYDYAARPYRVIHC